MKSIDEEIKTTFKNPQQKAHINILYTHNWVTHRTNAVFKEHNITMQQYNVLRILKGVHPKSKTPSEVKEVMLDKNPDLTRLIDRLVKKEFVIRQDCKINRRQVNLFISKAGIDYINGISPKIEASAIFTSKLTNTEAETLSNLLDKLRS